VPAARESAFKAPVYPEAFAVIGTVIVLFAEVWETFIVRLSPWSKLRVALCTTAPKPHPIAEEATLQARPSDANWKAVWFAASVARTENVPLLVPIPVRESWSV